MELNSKISLAVLMTCYNRKEKTLHCLNTLKKQVGIDNVDLKIYLVDDGSSDGTSEAVTNQFSEVNLLKGDGSLFWGGGMHLAMATAMSQGYDFYLWLNDDVELYEDALVITLKTYYDTKFNKKSNAIIGGVFVNRNDKNIAYGGWNSGHNWHPLQFKIMDIVKIPAKCRVLNGNLVLISDEAARKTGNLDPRFPHATGDFEYCLRAAKYGIESWVVPNWIGECDRNESKGTWQDTSLPLKLRYQKLLSIKGHPVRSRFIYFSKYGGLLWPVAYLWIYLRPLIDQLKK